MKSGLDYFSLDVILDTKFRLIEAEFGLKGFAVIVKLYQMIYKEYGYYAEWTNEVALLFADEIGLGNNAVSEIVAAAIRRGIFDKTMYDYYGILTSRGIQTRYFKAVIRRKKVEVKKQYLLLPFDLLPNNVYILEENADISGENTYTSKQSKVKESKVKESKEKERERKGESEDFSALYGTYQNVKLTDKELDILKMGFPSTYEQTINNLSDYMKCTGKSYNNHFAVICKWAKEDSTKEANKGQKSVKNQPMKGYRETQGKLDLTNVFEL